MRGERDEKTENYGREEGQLVMSIFEVLMGGWWKGKLGASWEVPRQSRSIAA